MTTLIKNGTIITATDTYRADILVKNGRVCEIGGEISKIANEIIDATGKWVLPGAVDAHTHLDVECDGTYTRGMTVVDQLGVTVHDTANVEMWRPHVEKGAPWVTVCWEIDAARWKDLLYQTMR